jgi:cyclopropane fatty-acyl-phospholipid synthase-like methyltransferase
MQKEFYDNDYYYGGKGYSFYGINAELEQFAEEIKKLNPESVLEFGCATGIVVELLRKSGINAIGMDISSFIIDNKIKEMEEFLFIGDVTKSPVIKNVDLIVSGDTLEHIDEQYLPTVRTWLRKYGKRFYFKIGTSETPDMTRDKSHVTIKPLQWWREWMPEAIIISSQ